MRYVVKRDDIYAELRECWILASDKRQSCRFPGKFGAPDIHSIVVESVRVPPEKQRQGVFKRFIEDLCRDPRFEMVVVEGVGNATLADALMRWGWEYDLGVMDFYKKTV
jgi:hypothetical protein